MNADRINTIVSQTTMQLRKGAARTDTVKDGVRSIVIYDMPSVDEAPADVTVIDAYFVAIGVNKAKAEAVKDELYKLLADEPIFQKGPSYIHIGAELGDQGQALGLFALGQALGFWKIITPQTFGFEGAEADEMAGRGFVMITWPIAR